MERRPLHIRQRRLHSKLRAALPLPRVLTRLMVEYAAAFPLHEALGPKATWSKLKQLRLGDWLCRACDREILRAVLKHLAQLDVERLRTRNLPMGCLQPLVWASLTGATRAELAAMAAQCVPAAEVPYLMDSLDDGYYRGREYTYDFRERTHKLWVAIHRQHTTVAITHALQLNEPQLIQIVCTLLP